MNTTPNISLLKKKSSRFPFLNENIMNSHKGTLENHHNNNYTRGVNNAHDYINSRNTNGNIKFYNILKKEKKSTYNRGFINTYRKSIKKGGSALPLRYFDPLAEQSSATAGHDMLTESIRPRIGGKRRSTKRKRVKGGFTQFAAKGGFIPSIMEPFALACSKYVMPVAGLSAYKLFHNPSKKYRR